MQNDIILLLVVLIVVICFGVGYWLFVRTVRELQASTQRQFVTLLALLKAMTYDWQQEKQAGNVQQIIEHSQVFHEELRNFVTQWKKLRSELRGTTTTFDQCTAIYQTTLFPVIQLICELDGIDADQYDMSGISKLRVTEKVWNLVREKEAFREEEELTERGKNRNDGEAEQPLNEGEPVQDSQIPSTQRKNSSMLCPFCYTPCREHARFCRGCGQSLAETDALMQIATQAVTDYRSMSLTELRQMGTTEATIERCRRAVDAIMAYNDTAAMPATRWYINSAVVIDLVGGRPPDVKAYLTSRRAEIEAHHQKYHLSSGHNRGRATSISMFIQIPEWSGRELELETTLYSQE